MIDYETKQRLIVYDNGKEEDILGPSRVRYKNIDTYIVNNWVPKTSEVVANLKQVGVNKVYLCIKLYDKTIKEVLDMIFEASGLWFDGVAIDGENYPWKDDKPNNMWTDKDRALELGTKIREFCEDIGLQCILLPEYLGMGDKYKYYEWFISALDPNKILIEKTYELWEPWNIYKHWKRNKEYPGEKCIGIWQDSIKWPLFRMIQFATAKVLSNKIFYYTEEKFNG